MQILVPEQLLIFFVCIYILKYVYLYTQKDM